MFDVVMKLAWSQHGAFCIQQAADRGVTRSWISRHAARGAFVRRARGVYVLAGTPDTARQRLMVHLLAAGDGAFGTGDSALALWCPELILPGRPVLAVPRDCGYQSTDAMVWRSSDLELAKPGVVDGIPVVGVARALLDAAASCSADALETRIDACRRHLPLSMGALVEALHAHARPGRPGITVFRQALRSLQREVTDSEFERLVIRDLRHAGVPEPRLHHLVRLPGEDPIELDLDWPGLRLDVELDGGDHVDRARRAQRDRQRDRLLQAAGWLVPRYTWNDYVSDRNGMIAEIAAFVAQRTADLSPGLRV